MICVALQLFYHSIRGTRVRLGPYVFSMRQAFRPMASATQGAAARDGVAEKMTAQQIAEARRRAREWKPAKVAR